MHPASNITVSPLAQAKAVKDPAIGEVIDLDTGEFVDATEFISGHLFQAVVEQRVDMLTRMVAGTPHYVCSTCHVPVYLVSRPEEHIFFFRHRHEDGSCPARTRSPLSEHEIRARKYHGLRESEPHKRVKALILRSLDTDTAFSDVRTERNWRSDKNAAVYRRPDVQADHGAGRLAFEVQLSTTFLSVVVGRREFYRQEGALLVWVFAGFDPDYRLLTTNDLLFSNNSNVFVVDDETARISEQTGAFHLRCHYRRPLREGATISDCWEERIAPFHELIQDRERQRAYLFDYAGAEDRLRQEIVEEGRQRTAEAEATDKSDFQEFWFAHGRHYKHTPENGAAWERLRERFATRGIVLPDFPDSDQELAAMLNTLYSMRDGVPVVWKFTKLVQIAHLLAESHPKQLVTFGHAVKVYKREAKLNEDDSSRKWRKRVAGEQSIIGLSARMHAFDLELRPDASLLPMMRFLFPKVAQKVEAYLAKAAAHDEAWD